MNNFGAQSADYSSFQFSVFRKRKQRGFSVFEYGKKERTVGVPHCGNIVVFNCQSLRD